MFSPWITIPVENVMVSVDYNFGDVRIMFRDTETINKTIDQLVNARELVSEMERSENKEVIE